MEEARKSASCRRDGQRREPDQPARAAVHGAGLVAFEPEEGAGLKHLKAQQGLQFKGNKEDFHAQEATWGGGESCQVRARGELEAGRAAASGIGDDGLSRPSIAAPGERRRV